jgi:putative ABC transport system permease protein
VSPGQFEKNTERLGLVKKYMDQGDYARVTIGLQPLSDIHFNALYEDSYGRRVGRSILNGLMAIAAFILLIASVNFINLSTAQSLRRAKEIGIRKVLCAGVPGIVYMLSKDFLYLVLLAIVIASPVAYYFMHGWLRGFAYRINISWWTFAFAGSAALLIAFATVSFLVIKAAIANPVNSLRSD